MYGNYPQTVKEILDSTKKYDERVIAALYELRRSHAWRGTIQERFQKFLKLHSKLNEIYNKSTKLEANIIEENSDSGSSSWDMFNDTITLRGKLSVVTYLHEYAHALFGTDERKAVEWSVNLFKQVFLRSFERAGRKGHMLVKVNSYQREQTL